MESCEQTFLNSISAKEKTYTHHPCWFKFMNGDKYMPDFYCHEDNEYIEVAGTRQAYHANKQKYALMKIEYPSIKFRIVHLWKKTNPLFMNKSAIAKSSGATKTMVSYVAKNKRKTTNVLLAMELARLMGARPVDFLSDKVKGLALQINPRLNRKYRKA